MGYYRAGFDVVGIDIKPQPHYPFEFHQADAMLISWDGYDAVHASPPCQAYSPTARFNPHIFYPQLMGVVKTRLLAMDVPYVLENIVGAPMKRGFILCGEMFGLKTFRHRQFELNWPYPEIEHPQHKGIVDGKNYYLVAGHSGGIRRGVRVGTAAEWREAMGIDWMNRYELAEAVPPAYTEFLGKHMLEHIRSQAA